MLEYDVKVLVGKRHYFSYPSNVPIPRKGEIVSYSFDGQRFMKKVLNVRYDITETDFKITILCEI